MSDNEVRGRLLLIYLSRTLRKFGLRINTYERLDLFSWKWSKK